MRTGKNGLKSPYIHVDAAAIQFELGLISFGMPITRQQVPPTKYNEEQEVSSRVNLEFCTRETAHTCGCKC